MLLPTPAAPPDSELTESTSGTPTREAYAPVQRGEAIGVVAGVNSSSWTAVSSELAACWARCSSNCIGERSEFNRRSW